MKKANFYKRQIEGLSDVAETARVIEKSAASHIHFLKKKVAGLLEYKEQIQKELSRLSRFYWDNNHPLLQERIHGKRALLVITGEKGMVAGLYHQLINEVVRKSKDYEHIWVIGNKGKEYLNQEQIKFEDIFNSFSFEDLPENEKIHQLTHQLFQLFQELNLKKIDVLYPQFISLASQKPNIVQLLPFSFALIGENNTRTPEGFPIFEPSKQMIFSELLKRFINIFFTEIIFEAKLSELSARTVTAENAAKETELLIRKLYHQYLKARYSTITQKQIESFSVHQLTKI